MPDPTGSTADIACNTRKPKGPELTILKYTSWLLTVLTVFVFLAMVGITLPHLTTLAGGQLPFDARLFGYDFGTAQDLLTRLLGAGTAYYNDVQHPLDSAFALMFCLVVVYWQIWTARRWQGYGLPLGTPVLAAILTTVVIASAADLGENAAVSAMLAVGPIAVTPSMVATAANFTMAKVFFGSIGLISLLVLGVTPYIIHFFRGRKP